MVTWGKLVYHIQVKQLKIDLKCPESTQVLSARLRRQTDEMRGLPRPHPTLHLSGADVGRGGTKRLPVDYRGRNMNNRD